MKMTRIRKLASALTLALVAFVVSGGDLAGPFFETVGGITWTYSVRDGMAVLGYRPSVKRAVDTTTVGDLTIPASLRGYPVREIGEFAFHSCMSLTSVTIPEGVTTLAPYSFTWCGVSTLDLPKSASYVTGEAFGTCGRSSKEYAMSVTVAEGNAHYKAVDGFLLTKDGTELVFSPMLKTRVVLPSTVKRIGIQAFCNHIRLEEVVVPASVETIGASAFIDCANLQKIVFGGNAPKIGASAFRNITATGYVGYGSTGWGTVPGTWNGISLVYEQDDGTYQETVDGLEWIYYVVQGGVELRSVRFRNMVGAVEIPGSLGGRPVTAIGADAFAGCAVLKSVTIPSSVTYIGPHAFDDCTALTKIAFAGAIPAGVADSGLLAQAVEVSCKRADVRTVQELAPDGCNVYIWTTNG